MKYLNDCGDVNGIVEDAISCECPSIVADQRPVRARRLKERICSGEVGCVLLHKTVTC